jgi:hypothetical protein
MEGHLAVFRTPWDTVICTSFPSLSPALGALTLAVIEHVLTLPINPYPANVEYRVSS